MALVRTYRITFKGKPLDVEAIVEGDGSGSEDGSREARVQVFSVSSPGDRDPKVYAGLGSAAEGSDTKPMALAQWSSEDRLQLFGLVRIAHWRKQRLTFNG